MGPGNNNATGLNVPAGPGSFSYGYRDVMFEADPYINVMFDDTLRPVDCNPTAVSYFDFSSKEELLQGFLPLINSSIPAFQPDASPSIPLGTRFEYVIQNGSIEFEIEMVFSKKRIPMRFILKKIAIDGSFVIAGYMIDMSQLKEARNELIRQDFLMRQVNQVATRLMSAEPEHFDGVVIRCLKLLARSVHADQISIWQSVGAQADSAKQLYGWDASNGNEDASDMERPKLEFTRIPEWWALLARKQNVNTSLNGMELGRQDGFVPRGAKSILLIPIFLTGAFWGFINLTCGNRAQSFSTLDEKVLHSGGIMIVQAIMRNQITQSLILAREDALTSGRAKSDFLSHMSHEIRTPMNAIIGMTAIGKSADNIRRKDYCLTKIEDASQHLLGIINDILDMSKIEANKFELSQAAFRFENMLQRAVDVAGLRANEKHQKITVQIDPAIPKILVGDDQRLVQVITNLLGNAIKFTPENGRIALQAALLRRGGDACSIQVAVRDNGIGIAAEQQKNLFRSFQQAESNTTRRFGGTGLGLAISKSIVEMMGGSIWVESEPGKGASFIFTVQLTRGQSEAAGQSLSGVNRANASVPPVDVPGQGQQAGQAAPGAPGCFAGRRILMAEDVEINREIVLALLEPTQVEIDCAENGAAAVRMFKEAPGRYDLILMDLQMPEMDGFDATRRIRAYEGLNAASVPIIAMTANAFNEDVQQCLAAGMNDHLAKPIDLDTTMKKLAKYLSP